MLVIRPLLALALLVLLSGVVSGPVQAAEESGPLFLNMTSDEPHRAAMAIGYGRNQLGRGHALTLFLNDRGVMIASQAKAGEFAEQQAMIRDIMAKGGVVLACPTCMKRYGVAAADLMPGVGQSTPDMTGAALFAPGARALSW